MKYIKALLMIVCFQFLMGCNQEFNDISKDEKFSNLVGKNFKSTADFLLLGVTTDKSHADKVNFYLITRAYGVRHNNPEVISTKRLKRGTKFQVEKILKCNNCFLFSRIEIAVSIFNVDIESVAPIYLSFDLKQEINEAGLVGLNSELFKELE